MPTIFRNSVVNFVLLSIVAVAPSAAYAQDLAPDVLVKTISQDIVALVRHHRDTYVADPGKLAELVEERVLPHFNFEHTTRMAMGAGWRRASPEQQGRLIREFKTLLVHTYSNALMSYRDQTIEYQPLRIQPGDTQATVRSRMKKSGTGESIAIDYAMENTRTGWKIFDLKIGGISLAAAYRDSFAEEIRNHGIDGLIDLLANKNRQAGAMSALVGA